MQARKMASYTALRKCLRVTACSLVRSTLVLSLFLFCAALRGGGAGAQTLQRTVCAFCYCVRKEYFAAARCNAGKEQRLKIHLVPLVCPMFARSA
jgi:hypothetical protein